MLWLVTAVIALLAPANAAAHGRGPTVALDDRVTVARTPSGVSARILDGDRSLELRVARDVAVVVRGYLDEPMLRFGHGLVQVNRSSATAVGDRIVEAGHGWQTVTRGTTFAWHEHRLSPPRGRNGTWTVPLTIEGRKTAIGGAFVRVGRPGIAIWLLGGIVAVAAVAVTAVVRPRIRGWLALVLAPVAGSAALVAIAAFAVRDAPSGGIQWFQLAGGVIVGGVGAAVLVRLRGAGRVAAAGVIGALAAAAMLGSLSVFAHGVVISALPAPLVRLTCASALVAGVCAAALSLLAEAPRLAR